MIVLFLVGVLGPFLQHHTVKSSFRRELLNEEMKVTCISTGEKAPRCRACADGFLMDSAFSPDSFQVARVSFHDFRSF